MQPLRRLMKRLSDSATADRRLFTPSDLRAIVPDLSNAAFKTLLSRAVTGGHLNRLCRGLYMIEGRTDPSGLLLFHAAARLRADCFNYISLETVLSDAGVISQLPMNRITVMSSGRSSVISCGAAGTVEFVRTRQRPEALVGRIHYDAPARMWRASVPQALRDIRATHRSTDLIDWSAASEHLRSTR